MPIAVQVYTFPPAGGSVAINRLDLRMYDLPAVGSGYWRDREPFTVREVDESTDPPTVHLEHDRDREEQVRAALPEGYWVGGGRSDVDGRWHFHLVREGVDRPIGMFFADSLDEAFAEATAAAHRRHAAQGG